jgi:multisubunit Na+/H+ antiporter MnhB subunit
MKSLPNRFPLPFLILAMLALLAALWAGLMRLGWRVIADYANWHILRMWGGLLNEVAILLFIGITVMSIRKSIVGK